MSAVNPAISNVSPAGAAIGTQTPWQCALTLDPANGKISRIIVLVEFPQTGVIEAVYFNGGFNAAYTGASFIEESLPGTFSISVIRNGGWPSSPNVFVHANSDAGGMTE